MHEQRASRGEVVLTTVQQFASHYIQNMGFHVVPLVGKACFDNDWQHRTYDIQHFNGHTNIGIRSVNGLVILDDDFPTPAVECADALLPQTGAVYGRPSKPRAKRLYLCPDLTAPIVFKDLDGKTVFEVRVGHQDMAPPSIHPETGELLAWTELLRPPAPIKADDLRLFARSYWAARLLGHIWPPHGRHDMRLACASLLLGPLGVPKLFAHSILEWACRLGGSDSQGIKDAFTAIETTARRLDARQATTGGPTLARLLPQDIGRRLVALLREGFDKSNQTESAIEDLNEQYFIIDVGSDTVVGEEVEQGNWTDLQFRSFEDFKKKLIKRSVKTNRTHKDGSPIYAPLADVWLRHPQGRQFNKLVYAPPGSSIPVGSRDLNGWRGFTVEPTPGAWALTRDTFIRNVVCRGNRDAFEWLLDWMAALFQQPGRHAETAIVGIGKQGIGKNVWAKDVLARTFDGRHARVTTHIRQVLGEFNDILSGLCLLVLDEVGLTTERDYNAMKGLITGDTIDINRKGISVSTERSMLHAVFLSNYEVPLKVASDDRRFAFYHFADTYQNDTTFFGDVVHELERGGRAAMLHELLARQVHWERLHHALDSDLKQTAKREGWSFAQWFVFRRMREIGKDEWDRNLHLLESGDKVFRVVKQEWAAEYGAYVKDVDVRRSPRDAYSELMRELRKLVPEGWEVNRVVWDKTERKAVRDFWTLPSWEVFKASFEQAVGCTLTDMEDAPLEDAPPF